MLNINNNVVLCNWISFVWGGEMGRLSGNWVWLRHGAVNTAAVF